MDLWEALNKRRSIRKYRDVPIPEETLLKLVSAATLAPSNANVQPWEFLFITEPELVNKIQNHVWGSMQEYWSKGRVENLTEEKVRKILNSTYQLGPVPVYMFVCLDTRAGRLKSAYSKWNDLWNHHSVAAAFNNFMLAAAAEGLGTCWLGVSAWNTEKLKIEFSIPEYIEIIAACPIGFPDEDPSPRPRKTSAEVTHFNNW